MEFLTSREAARLLNVSVRTTQQWVERGKLSAWKTEGGHRRISRDSVLRLLHSQADEAAAAANPAVPVLVIEDDPALLKLYRLQFAGWPYDVALHTARNGYEGLVMVGEVAPRLLLCDLRLPGVNGFQIIRSLCEIPRYRQMEVVVITGLSPAEIEAHGGLPERVRRMGKPIDFGRLREIVGRLASGDRGGATAPAKSRR